MDTLKNKLKHTHVEQFDWMAGDYWVFWCKNKTRTVYILVKIL